jgi:hypothetical protein
MRPRRTVSDVRDGAEGRRRDARTKVPTQQRI